jgi:predicted AlkP superfamily pyrophosphatase or phosphodiesterase
MLTHPGMIARMMRMRQLVVLLIVVWCGGCGPRGRATVVWISIDGFRYDYPDKTVTPLMHRFMREGAYSRDLVTITPSLTFPSHVTEATGVRAGEHGIVSNDQYDTRTRQLYNFPNDPALLEAEPIWITAKRQGVRTLVYDWPLSYGAIGGVRCDYMYEKFDGKPSDEERLDALIATWRNDRGKEPLRLLMGYIKKTDSVGHKHGPDSPQTADVIRESDTALGNFVERCVEQFKRTRRGGDQLYILITTDHGMMNLHTLVNAEKLFTALPKQVRIVTAGALGLIHLDAVAAEQREPLKRAMLNDLKRYDFVTGYTHETLPKEWGLDHPTRIGEITLMLKPGYSFSRKYPQATTPRRDDDNKGMHGYVVADCPDMRGFMAIWRYPRPLGARDLDEVRVEQLHPTVAKLLNIKPSAKASAEPLPLP